MDVLLAGDAAPAGSLEAILRDGGLETAAHSAQGALAEDLVALEQAIEAEPPRLAIGVGPSDSVLALAITAPKLGVPFCAWLGDAGSDERGDERRILATLSSVGLPSLEGDAAAVAQQIAAWLAEKPLDVDLHSTS